VGSWKDGDEVRVLECNFDITVKKTTGLENGRSEGRKKGENQEMVGRGLTAHGRGGEKGKGEIRGVYERGGP